MSEQDTPSKTDDTGRVAPAVSDATKSVGAPEPERTMGPSLPAGAQLGRYTVLEKLGEGGMGVVYSAYDVQLQRKVAIKILRSAKLESVDASDGRARLLREAQALAQLAHPNVVGVHEVGTFENNVFMAMEFVEGQSLRDWLKEKARPWREVLRVFQEAARGLSAAHEKGLIHRDFKPDNVLLGRDGRVRVLDFGLARAATPAGLPTGAPITDTHEISAGAELKLQSSSTNLATPLTQVGRVVGTLPYMAPELLQGSPASVSTDVFAFCVSLYEALYGKRPFALRGQREVAPPPEGSSVPAWLRRAVLKGLGPTPEERAPSIHAVQEALARDPGPRRRRIALGAGALLGVGVLVAVSVHLAGRKNRLCDRESDRLVGVWDEPAAQRLQRGFLGSGAPRADEAFVRVRRALDVYARDVVSMRTEACVDTRIRGSQPDAVMGLRMACLDRRLSEFSAFVDVFSQPDAAMVSRAPDATAKLTPVQGCSDLAALKAPIPLPEDPTIRAQVLAAQQQLAKADALVIAGKYKAALALLDPVIARAQALHYRPLEAEAALTKAAGAWNTSREVVAAYRQAYLAALADSHSEVMAKAAIGLLFAFGRNEDLPSARQWGEVARAVIERMGGDLALEAKLEASLGAALMDVEVIEAEAHIRRALAVDRQLPRTPNNVRTMIRDLGDLAIALEAQYRYDEAIAAGREALAISRQSPENMQSFGAWVIANTAMIIYDKSGPLDEVFRLCEEALPLAGERRRPLARCHFVLGLAAKDRGQLGHGLAEMHEGLTLFEQEYGKNGTAIADMHLMISDGELALGRDDLAQAEAEHALAMARDGTVNVDALGPAHTQLGLIALARGRNAEALVLLRKGLEIVEAAKGPKSREVTTALVPLARAYLENRASAKALAVLDRASEIQAKLFPKDFVELAEVLLLRGQALLLEGRAVDAVAPLEEALQRVTAGQFGPARVAPARFALARALWASPRERPRALELARQAHDELSRAEGAAAKGAKPIAAWLERAQREADSK